MYELSDGHPEFRRKRRATDRAEDRADRAADRGDTAAMRIAGAQLEQLLRERAAYSRRNSGSPRRRDIGEVA